MPQLLLLQTGRQEKDYLRNIYELTYINDVVERNHIRNSESLQNLVRILASSIGAPTNARRMSNTFASVERKKLDKKLSQITSVFCKTRFMIEEAPRYDVKGRKYIGTETKYYFADMGLRAVALNFRQQEETRIMENIIYNELRTRGYLVDVGMVEIWNRTDNNVYRCPLLKTGTVSENLSLFGMMSNGKPTNMVSSLRHCSISSLIKTA